MNKKPPPTMKKSNTPTRLRKRIAQLNRELAEINAKAYKLDGDDGYEHGDRINSRFEAKYKELQKLRQLTNN